jgi:hypothetical protein
MQATEVGSGGGGSNGGAGGSHVTFNVGEVRILILYFQRLSLLSGLISDTQRW